LFRSGGRTGSLVFRSWGSDSGDFAGGERAVGRDAGRDDCELVTDLPVAAAARPNGVDEGRNEIAFARRLRSVRQRLGMMIGAARRVQPRALVVVDEGRLGPEDADHVLMSMDAAEVGGDAADHAAVEAVGGGDEV